MYNIYKFFPFLQYVNQRLQIQLELLMMSGVPLETCWSFNERWNKKFFYEVASCWLFLLNYIQELLYYTHFDLHMDSKEHSRIWSHDLQKLCHINWRSLVEKYQKTARTPLNNPKYEHSFCLNAPHPTEHYLLLIIPGFVLINGGIKMETSFEQWCNDTDRGKPREVRVSAMILTGENREKYGSVQW